MAKTVSTMPVRCGKLVHHVATVTCIDFAGLDLSDHVAGRLISRWRIQSLESALALGEVVDIGPIRLASPSDIKIGGNCVDLSQLDGLCIVDGRLRRHAIQNLIRQGNQGGIADREITLHVHPNLSPDAQRHMWFQIQSANKPPSTAQRYSWDPTRQDVRTFTYEVMFQADWNDLVHSLAERTGTARFRVHWFAAAVQDVVAHVGGAQRAEQIRLAAEYLGTVRSVLHDKLQDPRFVCSTYTGLRLLGLVGREVVASPSALRRVSNLAAIDWAKRHGDFVGVLTSDNGTLLRQSAARMEKARQLVLAAIGMPYIAARVADP